MMKEDKTHLGERVAELNRGRIGYGPYFHLDAMAPTDLSMGFIRISRVHSAISAYTSL